MNVASIVKKNAETTGDKIAIIYQTKQYSYAQVWSMIIYVAEILSSHGIKKGDRVGLSMKDRPLHLISHFAVAVIGAVIVPIDHRWTVSEKESASHTFKTKLILNEGGEIYNQYCCRDKIMIQITSRDKKVLFAGGAFIIFWFLFTLVAQPMHQENKRTNQKIQDKLLFIQKCYEILNQKSYYKAKSKENKLIRTTLDQRFFNQTKPALAASEQQHLIENLSNQTGVNILRFRVDKPKYLEGLLTISTKVTTRSKLRNFTNFINMVESNQKFMVIEEMTIQRINDTDLEELQAQLTISGFIQSMDTGVKKTT